MPPDQLLIRVQSISKSAYNETLALVNRLRPVVMIHMRDLNSKLDASGRYTKKILGVSILLLIMIYDFVGRSNKSQVNEFRAHAVITMEDHLKNQAIRAQLESKINQTEAENQTNANFEKESPTIQENDQIPKELAQRIVDSWETKSDKPVEEKEEKNVVLGENEFRPFGGGETPDLSNLPEEIPIPGEVAKMPDYTINVPPPANMLNVVESMGSEEIQHKRQLAVKKACYMPRLRYNIYNQTSRFYSLDDLQPDDFKHFIVDDASKVIYCAVSKAGNTNWKKVMAVLGGAINNRQKWHYEDVDDVPGQPGTPIHESWFFKRLSSYNMTEIKQRLTDRYYHKFTFVRDPLSRILSAYLDKFNNDNTIVAEYYKRWYGRYIMNTYQNGAASKESENYKVEWKSFLKYIVDHDNNDLNEHWDRQFTLCHPCHVHFDFVGKIEEADTEASYMLDRFRLSGLPGVR